MRNLAFILLFVHVPFVNAQNLKTFEYTDSSFEIDQVHYLELHFGFDHPGLLDDSATNKTIQDLVEFLSNHKNIVISLDYHTSSQGSAERNLLLSEKRTQQVQRVLIDEYGLDSTQIKTKGFGESMPIIPDTYINQLGWKKEDKELIHRLNIRMLARIIVVKDL